jgi:hypothetical protein
MRTTMWFGIAAALLAVGCYDGTAPRDLSAPAAPRGLFSTTGDHEVILRWLANTERDVAGYRVYEAPCASGDDCPYDLVATTGQTSYRVTGLSNGVTRYFAVAAFDHAGNESRLSHEDVFDTPRPEGFDQLLRNQATNPPSSGWDFSAYAVRPFDDDLTDIFFGTRDGVPVMVAPFTDTDLQDAGYTTDLDGVDYSPSAGWSPSGVVELIPGHSYVVWTHDDHFAKFRVTAVSTSQVLFDWAYQVDPGNRELQARPTGPRVRRTWPGA